MKIFFKILGSYLAFFALVIIPVIILKPGANSWGMRFYSHICFILIAYAFTVFVDNKPWNAIWPRVSKNEVKKYLWGCGLAALTFFVMLFASIVSGAVSFQHFGLSQYSLDKLLVTATAFLFYTCIVGISEELYFRGYVFKLSLLNRARPVYSMVLAAFFFTLIHISKPEGLGQCMYLMGVLAAGLSTCCMVVLTGSLSMGMGYHFLTDYLYALIKITDYAPAPWVIFSESKYLVMFGLNFGPIHELLFCVVQLSLAFMLWKKIEYINPMRPDVSSVN